jgi:hypothetical protein
MYTVHKFRQDLSDGPPARIPRLKENLPAMAWPRFIATALVGLGVAILHPLLFVPLCFEQSRDTLVKSA